MKQIPAILTFFLQLCGQALSAPVGKPNIVIIYADDLGYGDVKCYNPGRGKIPTPHIDKLAAEGMRFTDGHSSSGVCTPSRYTLLTGRYHWRSRLQRSVLGGMSPPLIAPDRLTLAGFLKQHGYATACIGKWHLGMTMPKPLTEGTVRNGPITNGFDYYFGISASLDMPPYAFIENDRFTEPPSDEKNLLFLSGNQTDATRQGPAAPGFESVQVLPKFEKMAVQWMKENNAQPFFLYLAMNSPHTPLAPTPEWKGKSGLGDYADFVMQTDAAVGEIMAALDEMNATQDTLVFLSSDNGPANYVGTKVSDNPRDSHEGSNAIGNLEDKGHFPAGPLRGYKGSIQEGGHRVPFIVRWPAVVKPGGVSSRLVHQADLMRTFSDVLGVPLPDNVGEDSFSFLALLKGEDKPTRGHAISANGAPALRLGPWKYIPAPVQLYNLGDDLGETNNLAATMPEKVAEMKDLLEKLITDGRSTPGAPQKNDVEVTRYPSEKPKRKHKK